MARRRQFSALDQVAPSIDGSVERVRYGPRCRGRDHGLDAVALEPLAQTFRVIGFVRDQPSRWSNYTEKRHGHADVGDVAGRQRERDRSAAIIGQAMDFRGAAAP